MLPDKYYLIKKEDLAHNIQRLREKIPGKIYAVIKADGYGLGCQTLALACAENGIRYFAVTTLQEAESLVAAGVEFDELLLMASAAPEQIDRLAELGVTFTVASALDAQNLVGRDVNAHLKVETGMGRRGFLPEDMETITAMYTAYPNIHITGIYTHFMEGDNRKRTMAQYEKFQSVLKALEERGIQPGVRHCCNSAAAIWQPDLYLDAVRLGSALLGRHPGAQSRMGLRRVGMGYVRIESLHTLPKGATVGYGGLYRAKKPITVAVCPVGTHHGLGVMPQKGVQTLRESLLEVLRMARNRMTNRNLPSVMIGGKRCQALGSVCSEVVMVDVTEVSCAPGEYAQVDINPILLHYLPVIVE